MIYKKAPATGHPVPHGLQGEGLRLIEGPLI